MIEIKDFHKAFYGQTLLKIPRLHLREGAYWLRGANGSGKTTFLKCLAGLLPYDGSLSIGGVEEKKERMPYRRLIHYSEGEPQYPSFLTGMDMVRFYQKVRGGSEGQLDILSKHFGVGCFLKAKMGTYSSGMLKKLSLLLTFIGKPKWMLLDEPFNALEGESCAALLALIEKERREGVSFLITSHQPFSERWESQAQVLVLQNKTLLTLTR